MIKIIDLKYYEIPSVSINGLCRSNGLIGDLYIVTLNLEDKLRKVNTLLII